MLLSFIRLFIWGVVGSLCLFSVSYAQEEETEQEIPKRGIKRYRNEIAIDLSGTNLIPFANYNWNGYYYPNYYGGRYSSMMYRNYKVKEKFRSSTPGVKDVILFANRFRLGTFLSNSNIERTSSTSGSRIQPTSIPIVESYFFFARAGRERQENFGRFQLHYGLDIVIDFNRTKETNEFYEYDNSVEKYFKSNSFEGKVFVNRGGISPLIGFKYFLHSRISFSTEAVLDLMYRLEKKTEVIKRYNNQNQEVDQTEVIVKSNGFLIALFPIYTFNLGFHF